MTANSFTSAATPPSAPPPRFDAKFIEEHRLIERYLEHKLPPKGARELEHWCRDNPEYLDGLKLAERAQASLALLEACGRPLDLSEPRVPWWKSPYVPIACGVLASVCLVGLWALYAHLRLVRGQLDDARARQQQGSLVQPATTSEARMAPDHAPGIGTARLAVSQAAPQLIDLHVDMGYTKSSQFRMIVDKKDQGRALILNNLLKDSNGELRLTFNTSGLSVGTYAVRIEALPFHASGNPVPEGWMILEVR